MHRNIRLHNLSDWKQDSISKQYPRYSYPSDSSLLPLPVVTAYTMSQGFHRVVTVNLFDKPQLSKSVKWRLGRDNNACITTDKLDVIRSLRLRLFETKYPLEYMLTACVS
jgi:hypothetical protein